MIDISQADKQFNEVWRLIEEYCSNILENYKNNKEMLYYSYKTFEGDIFAKTGQIVCNKDLTNLNAEYLIFPLNTSKIEENLITGTFIGINKKFYHKVIARIFNES